MLLHNWNKIQESANRIMHSDFWHSVMQSVSCSSLNGLKRAKALVWFCEHCVDTDILWKDALSYIVFSSSLLSTPGRSRESQPQGLWLSFHWTFTVFHYVIDQKAHSWRPDKYNKFSFGLVPGFSLVLSLFCISYFLSAEVLYGCLCITTL